MGLTRPTVSQLNTVVTEISDPVSVLNKGSTLANIDVGFVLNRDGGISSNAAIIWQESSDQFVLGLTANTGAVFANIVISEYANLRVNQLTGTLATAAQPNITSVGNLTSLAASGNISTTGYLFGNGSQLTGIITSVTRIVNGTSNVTAYENGNIAVTVGGTTNTAIFTTSGITVSGNISASYFTGSGTALTGINSFGNIFIDGQGPVLADNTSDTLTLVSGSGIAITTDAANDSITFSSVSTSGPFATSGDFGAVNDPVTVSEDEGSVADGATITYDLGSIISASGLIYPDQLVLPSYSVSTLPSATVAAQLVYNTTANGLAFSDGTNWSNIGASYSNVQVATYLPTYTGTVSASLINSSGNVLSTGLSVFGNTRIGSLATPGAEHTIIGNVSVSGAGTEYFNIGGNILAIQGSFGSINSTGFINTSGNVSSGGTILDSKGDVRSAPQNSQGGAYTLVVGDAGKHISITTGGVTVNASIFSIGDMITVYNNSGSSQNITQGASVTLRLAGTATTGTRALAQYGVATLLCVTGGATPTFACSGAGLT